MNLKDNTDNKLTEIRQKVNSILNQYHINKGILKKEQQSLKDVETALVSFEQAQSILQQVAQSIQQKAHQQIARVVTECLQMVFYDEDYGFKIRFERKRGKTEAKLLLINRGHDVENPLDEDSGGVMDVASFALRLSCLFLTKPNLRKLLVMDEPFKNVSEEYQDNVRNMLEKLTKEFGLQIIIVTHEQGFQCGKVVRLNELYVNGEDDEMNLINPDGDKVELSFGKDP